MDPEEFRHYGKCMIDFMADYIKTLRSRDVLPSVEPGYLKQLLPAEPPQQPDTYEDIMKDVEHAILPGVTHWSHPSFFAYYPTANSFPALLGDMLSGVVSSIGFSWASNPAGTELEMLVMNWLAKACALPEHFLFTSAESSGGGVIQGTASEASLISVLAARSKVIRQEKERDPTVSLGTVLDKMVAYASDQAHSSVERACQIALVRLRHVPTDDKRGMRASALRDAIVEDREEGLNPLICIATLGTTASCAFDNLDEVADVCNSLNVWCHVDAAYAGSALICPEFRYFARGIEKVDSFNFNPHKMLRVNFDCSALWLKDKCDITEAFNVDPLYLKHDYSGVPDFRHWQIPLGRRFRSLKLWFVMRLFGVTGLQEEVRKHVRLAKEFKEAIEKDDDFELVNEVILGLVCFRLKGPNSKTESLYEILKQTTKLFLVPSHFDDTNTYFLRLVSGAQCQIADIQDAYRIIRRSADTVLQAKTDLIL